MALSNWDTLAVDLAGKSVSGEFRSKMGVVVEFYKNWLYVRDKNAWQDGTGYSDPTVMEIHSGELAYKGIDICAVRGPQDGIYAVISERDGDADIGMIGCGVYGYEGDEFVGVTPDSLKFLQEFISFSEPAFDEDERMEWEQKYKEGATKNGGLLGDGKPLEEGLKWLREYRHYRFDKAIADLKLNCATRFNQGDAYFANKLGDDTLKQETGIGEAKPTIMSKII